jgi:hypothetical protein
MLHSRPFYATKAPGLGWFDGRGEAEEWERAHKERNKVASEAERPKIAAMRRFEQEEMRKKLEAQRRLEEELRSARKRLSVDLVQQTIGPITSANMLLPSSVSSNTVPDSSGDAFMVTSSLVRAPLTSAVAAESGFF